MNSSVMISVPATSANLGPGFDSLGLALDLWNDAHFEMAPEGVQVQVSGEGQGKVPLDAGNLIARAALRVFALCGHLPAPGLRIQCTNRIPLGSGLGSSAAATLAGLLGGNALLESPLSLTKILELATEMEGHPDNVAPALMGSLVISTTLIPTPTDPYPPVIARRVNVPALQMVVVVPDVDFSTRTSRAALPVQIAIRDAVFNIGRVALVVEALRHADLTLLGQVMDDRLHQPYRLKLIPGAIEALQAAKDAGAAAVALSGAGPGIVAFTELHAERIAQAMLDAFTAAGISSRSWELSVATDGARVRLF